MKISNKTKLNNEAGSSLIAVIIITVVSITVIGAMVIIVSLVLLSTVGWQKSGEALLAAESYADDYILRVVRNPNTTPKPGENLSLNGAIAYPTLYPAPKGRPNILFITAKSGGYSRTLRIVYVVDGGKTTVVQREEVSE